MRRGLLGSSTGAVAGVTLLSDEPLPSVGRSVAMGTGWLSLLLVWLPLVSSGNLERTSSLSDPTLAVDTTGCEFDATGWEVDTTGWELDTTGWEVDTTGWEVDTTGWELDTTGWELLIVVDDSLTLVEIPVVGVVVGSSELVSIFLFIMLSSTCGCHTMY